MVGLTIIVPTMGRVSLESTLESIGMQTVPDDRVCVVHDTDRSNSAVFNLVYDIEGECEGEWSYIWVGRGAPLGAHGHAARNFRLNLVPMESDKWFVSIDDDDMFLPGAFDAIREAISENPDRWFVLEMVGGASSHFPGQIVPIVSRQLIRGNVGTPCIVAPASAKSRWGTMPSDLGDGYYGDWDYAYDLNRELGPPVWISRVIAEIRP
jgi:hypothetical protein